MKKRGNNVSPDWAVSETVGFIIIFGIMMSGIALVTLYGYPALLDAQENANIRNMERNMISLQSDVNALTYKSVPYKETTMQVSGGVLTNDSIISNFMISEGNGNPLITYPVPSKQGTGALNFTSDQGDISIALQNGAVVKWQAGGSVMLSEPRWFIDTTGGTRTMVITLIQVDSSAYHGKSGISSVKMSIEPLNIHDAANIIDKHPSDNTVRISITLADKYHRAWKNYFENTLKMTEVTSPLPPSPTWERTDIDRIIIKAWKINIINI